MIPSTRLVQRLVRNTSIRNVPAMRWMCLPSQELLLSTALGPKEDDIQPIHEETKTRFFWPLLKFMGAEQTVKMQVAACGLLRSTAEHILQEKFYQELQLRPVFQYQTDLLWLHLWMLRRRIDAMEDKNISKQLKDVLFQRLYELHDKSVVLMGVTSFGLGKVQKKLSIAFLDACIAYDSTLEKGSVQDFDVVLHTSIFKDTEGMHSHAKALRKYVDRERGRLLHLTDSEILQGHTKWGTPPTV